MAQRTDCVRLLSSCQENGLHEREDGVSVMGISTHWSVLASAPGELLDGGLQLDGTTCALCSNLASGMFFRRLSLTALLP